MFWWLVSTPLLALVTNSTPALLTSMSTCWNFSGRFCKSACTASRSVTSRATVCMSTCTTPFKSLWQWMAYRLQHSGQCLPRIASQVRASGTASALHVSHTAPNYSATRLVAKQQPLQCLMRHLGQGWTQVGFSWPQQVAIVKERLPITRFTRNERDLSFDGPLHSTSSLVSTVTPCLALVRGVQDGTSLYRVECMVRVKVQITVVIGDAEVWVNRPQITRARAHLQPTGFMARLTQSIFTLANIRRVKT